MMKVVIKTVLHEGVGRQAIILLPSDDFQSAVIDRLVKRVEGGHVAFGFSPSILDNQDAKRVRQFRINLTFNAARELGVVQGIKEGTRS